MKCCSKEVLNLFPWSLCHTSLAQSTQHRSQRHFTTAKNHKSRTADGSKKLQIVKAASFSPSEYPAFQRASDYCDDQMVVGAVSSMMLTTYKLQNNWCPNSLWKHTRMGCSARDCNAPLKLHFVSFKQVPPRGPRVSSHSKQGLRSRLFDARPFIMVMKMCRDVVEVSACSSWTRSFVRWACATRATSTAVSPLLMARPRRKHRGWFAEQHWMIPNERMSPAGRAHCASTQI